MYDSCHKSAIKARKAPEEMLTYVQVKEVVDCIEGKIAAEARDKEPANQKGPQGQGGGNQQGTSTKAKGEGNQQGSANEKGIGDDEAESDSDNRSAWRTFAKRRVQSYVSMVVEADSETPIVDALKNLTIAKQRGTVGKDYIAIWFAPQLASEPITDPHLRVGPLNKKRYGKLVNSVRRSRSENPNSAEMDEPMLPGDAAFILDAGRTGQPCLIKHLHASNMSLMVGHI